ncbi:MAG: hypoxanthine phosphoribosyltransferase [Desulfuromonadales bacterium]|jgi:hypoxanthine phosphoribosyltransferase|nr:hypoxanthine phosphoribosyltransferase [Desulfuromonadales bacterium]
MRILYSRKEIAARIAEMARQIDRDYQGRELLMVGVLKGSFLFIADLIREVQTPAIVDFMRIASYGSETQSSGIIEFRKDLELSIKGRDVLIVEDIVDSGQTLKALCARLLQREPASLRVCTLVDKKAARITDIHVDYVGFPLDDGFIVGYGLDWDERYRNLADIFLVETE